MTPHLDQTGIRELRLRAHGLVDRSASSVRWAATRTCGFQAQEAGAGALAVRARSTGVTAADVDEALRERTVVRTWCMRGTLHLVPRDDLAWMLPLLGPAAIRKSRRHREQLGLDDPILDRARHLLREMLEDEGAPTRDEIGARLAHENVPLEGQALYHFLRQMALEGVICVGPDREGEETYEPLGLEEGSSSKLSRDDALRRLTRRYLAGYGPATLDDLVRWSGLGKRAARSAWEDIASESMEVAIGSDRGRVLLGRAHELDPEKATASSDVPLVRLLTGYDPYLLGYRSRDFTVAPEDARRLHPGGGFMRPALLVGGQVEGIWGSEREADRFIFRVRPFGELSDAVSERVESEVADLGRFLDVSASLDLQALRPPAPPESRPR